MSHVGYIIQRQLSLTKHKAQCDAGPTTISPVKKSFDLEQITTGIISGVLAS